MQLGLERVPVDVEVGGVGGVPAVGEDVLPRGVVGADAGVVGDEIEDEREPRLARRLQQPVQPLTPAEVGADGVVVDDVVAVRGTGASLGDGGEVEVGDAEALEVGEEPFDLGEAEAGLELQAVGGGHAAGR